MNVRKNTSYLKLKFYIRLIKGFNYIAIRKVYFFFRDQQFVKRGVFTLFLMRVFLPKPIQLLVQTNVRFTTRNRCNNESQDNQMRI